MSSRISPLEKGRKMLYNQRIRIQKGRCSMTRYEQTLYISDEIIAKYQPLMRLKAKVDYDKYDLETYQTVESWSVGFPDGCVMDIKIRSGDRRDGDPLWSEAVLYRNGVKMTFTDIMMDVAAVYICELNVGDPDNHMVYQVTVLPESRKPA